MYSLERSNKLTRIYLVFSCILVAIGNCAGPLTTRLYFIHGGQQLWLSAWLQTAAWPLIVIPLSVAFLINRRRKKTNDGGGDNKFFHMRPFLFAASAAIGLLIGAIDYFYAYGSSKLPVSTTSLIYASQLAFNAGFSFLLVKQKFTRYSINTILSLIAGAVVLALYPSGGEGGESVQEGGIDESGSRKEYIVGFMMFSVATVAYGLVLPLMELSYKKADQAVSYTLATEFNLVMSVFATAFSTVAMHINSSFQAIPVEAREYELGEVKYYAVLVLNAIFWQCSLVGINGVIFCGSSLLSGILVAISIPITEVLAVYFYHENFHLGKWISLVLALWGFFTYFYGEAKYSKSENPCPELESRLIVDNNKKSRC